MIFERIKKKVSLLLSVSMLSLCLISCESTVGATGDGAENSIQDTAQQETQESLVAGDSQEEDRITLNVALFPYVPDLDKFQSVIEEKWKEEHSAIELNFETWDCYDEVNVPDSLDVFTFDAIYLTEYAKNGELLALSDADIKEQDDILGFVKEGLTVDGSSYGIPQMICANLFFYREGDTEIESADNVVQLYDVMGDNMGTEVKPAQGEGLLVDMSSGTGNICLYLDAMIDTNAVYSDYTVMPDLDNMNEQAIQSLNELVLMAGRKQAYTYVEGDYTRAEWFSQGIGRAYIGYSESMALMDDYVSEVQIKTMSLGDREDIPLFYADVIGVNSALGDDHEKKELAVELMNLMTSSEVMTEILGGTGDAYNPQYILPAKTSVYENLETKYPIYTRLKELTAQDGNHVFRMGDGAHDYIVRAKEILPNYLLKEE